MRKVLIADGAEGFRDQLEKLLAARHETVCVASGTQAWELFQRLQPDLLVMDLELPGIDGMTLLRRMHAAGFRPAVIIIGRLFSDYTIDTLIQMKVDYILRKPCKPQLVAEQVEALLQYRALEESPVRVSIAALLGEFYIPPHLDGSKYLISAVIRMAQNPSQYITKELYPSIGKEHGRSGGGVERSIRNAIESGWENGGQLVWERYFGRKEEGMAKKPNNTSFILAMVKLLKSGL